MDIKSILEEHQKWLRMKGGERANLSGADLSGADLSGADLSWADLNGADLSGADLDGANLSKADLRGANLYGANLSLADLSLANLRRANLRGANLNWANLGWANLGEADLSGANLCEAILCEAILRGADLRNIKYDCSTVGIHPAPEGKLKGYKKVAGVIVTLSIPEDAPRSCATTRKHRAAWAMVEAIDGGRTEIVSTLWKITTYRVGEMVYPDSWDEDRWNECSHGIHFFLTRKEADAWIE